MEIIGAISDFLVIAIPFITGVLFYTSKRRKARAEARQQELSADEQRIGNMSHFADEWRELYEKAEQKLEAKDKKIDQLYHEKEEDRNTIRSLRENLHIKELENLQLLLFKCEIRGCKERKPPSGI